MRKVVLWDFFEEGREVSVICVGLKLQVSIDFLGELR